MLTCLGSMPGGHEAFGSRSPVTTGLNTYRGSQTATERGNRRDQQIVSKEVSEIREGVGIILAAFVKDRTDRQWQETTKYHEWLAFMRSAYPYTQQLPSIPISTSPHRFPLPSSRHLESSAARRSRFTVRVDNPSAFARGHRASWLARVDVQQAGSQRDN